MSQYRSIIVPVFAMAAVVGLTGCPHVFDDGRERETWVRCDDFGCMTCSWEGCERVIYEGGCDEGESCEVVSCEADPGACLVADSGCETAADCDEGLCVDGECASCSGDCGIAPTCTLDAHCGEDRACLDGQCVYRCETSEACGSNQSCESGVCVTEPADACSDDEGCEVGEACVNGRCHAECFEDGICDNEADVCSDAITVGERTLSICYPDSAANPACSINIDCGDGNVCVDGVCRQPCDESSDCASCEGTTVCTTITVCLPEGAPEPQCALAGDCETGQHCLDAQCTTL